MRPRFEPHTDFDELITEKLSDLAALLVEQRKAVAETEAERAKDAFFARLSGWSTTAIAEVLDITPQAVAKITNAVGTSGLEVSAEFLEMLQEQPDERQAIRAERERAALIEKRKQNRQRWR